MMVYGLLGALFERDAGRQRRKRDKFSALADYDS
jgi:hypothetical protein